MEAEAEGLPVVRPLEPGDRARWEELFQGFAEYYGTSVPSGVAENVWAQLMAGGDAAAMGRIYGLGAFVGGGERPQHLVGFAHYHFQPCTWSLQPKCYLEDVCVDGKGACCGVQETDSDARSYVDPNVRSRGCGRRLFEAVFAKADEKGTADTWWITSLENDRARRLYDRVGKVTDHVGSPPSPPPSAGLTTVPAQVKYSRESFGHEGA